MSEPIATPSQGESYEALVLGAMLGDEVADSGKRGCVDLALSHLREEDFISEEHRQVFRAIKQCRKEDIPIDYATVAEKMGGEDRRVWLMELDEACPTTANTSYYVERVVEDKVNREQEPILNQARKAGDARGAFEILRKELERLESIGKPAPSMRELAPLFYEQIIDEKRLSFKTLSGALDYNLNGGLRGGRVYTLVAAAGGGKTTFALQLLEEVACRERIPCIFVALEMGGVELHIKTLSRLGEINSGKIEGRHFDDKTLEKLGRAEALYDRDYASHLYILEGAGDWTVDTIRGKVQAIRQSHKVDGKLPPCLICVDPFQRLSCGDPRVEADTIARVGRVASDLKRMARDLDVAVLLLSDTTKRMAERQEEGGRAGQGGVRDSYMAVHTTDVLGEIRIGKDLLNDAEKAAMAAEDTGRADRIGELKSNENNDLDELRRKYPESFPTYACISLSKQRSGSKIDAFFVYLMAYNKFIPLDPVKPEYPGAEET